MREEFFSLDIGTRKVMGIVCARNDELLEIIDTETVEHSTRPMLDGQIHSIDDVARTVRRIKEALEARLRRKLDTAGVAVAGRNLKTCRMRVETSFAQQQEITAETVRDLELQAVDAIESQSAQDLSTFYCVGYSTVYYELEGTRIGNPVGHMGKLLSAEIIVTFLPRVVLDSIFGVLKKAELEPTTITLEPIAAINAIVPVELRTLNIVLVDIGAGTSDLALAKNGVVFSYGMVPEAGDEITESISEALLVEFNAAEAIKRQLDQQQEISFEDIWGRQHCLDSVRIKECIAPAVKKLASAVAQAGLELNGCIPQAVVLVGGGSQTSGLLEALSSAFGLPAHKVGLRLPSAIRTVKDTTGRLTGPEAVTPLGIALMTSQAQGLRFITVGVNGQKVRVLDFHQKKDVLGALTASGILSDKKLYPRPGLALTIQVNGEFKVIKGTLGAMARITLNGKPVISLAEKVQEGDAIELEQAVDGLPGKAKVRDVVELSALSLVFNGKPVEMLPPVTMNGQRVRLDASVVDRAEIEVLPLTAGDVLESQGCCLETLQQRQVLVNVNGTPRVLTQKTFSLTINGAPVVKETAVPAHAVIAFMPEEPTACRIRDVVEIPQGQKKMRVTVDGKEVEIDAHVVQVFMNGRQVSPDALLIDGADIRVYFAHEQTVLLSEIFKYISVDRQQVLGKRMKLFVDDSPAGFTTSLTEGSRVRIQFEERT